MSLYRPSNVANPVLGTNEFLSFPNIEALPAFEVMASGTLLTFKFANGYGAHIVVAHGMQERLEFCVLDCTGKHPAPDFSTPVADHVLVALDKADAEHLLKATAALPLHPALAQSAQWLQAQQF